LWGQAHPRDEIPPTNLGVIYTILGDDDKALAAYQEALKLNPGSGFNYGNLVLAYLNLDRPDEAKAAANRRRPTISTLHTFSLPG
jgi:Flp pilus assembly protein TadD